MRNIILFPYKLLSTCRTGTGTRPAPAPASAPQSHRGRGHILTIDLFNNKSIIPAVRCLRTGGRVAHRGRPYSAQAVLHSLLGACLPAPAPSPLPPAAAPLAERHTRGCCTRDRNHTINHDIIGGAHAPCGVATSSRSHAARGGAAHQILPTPAGRPCVFRMAQGDAQCRADRRIGRRNCVSETVLSPCAIIITSTSDMVLKCSPYSSITGHTVPPTANAPLIVCPPHETVRKPGGRRTSV